MTEAELERYFSAFLVEQSRAVLRPKYPRMLTRLAQLGITRIPHPNSTSPEDQRAHEALALFVRQRRFNRRDKSIEHDLRDRLGIRGS